MALWGAFQAHNVCGMAAAHPETADGTHVIVAVRCGLRNRLFAAALLVHPRGFHDHLL